MRPGVLVPLLENKRHQLLEEADFIERKTLLRSFIRRMEVCARQVTACYEFPCLQMEKMRNRLEFYLLKPLVELRGFEPLTSSVQGRRSPI